MTGPDPRQGLTPRQVRTPGGTQEPVWLLGADLDTGLVKTSCCWLWVAWTGLLLLSGFRDLEEVLAVSRLVDGAALFKDLQISG